MGSNRNKSKASRKQKEKRQRSSESSSFEKQPQRTSTSSSSSSWGRIMILVVAPVLLAVLLQQAFLYHYRQQQQPPQQEDNVIMTESNELQTLVNWISRHGGFIKEGVQARQGPYGRGLFWDGEEALTKQTTLVTVPESLMLTSKSMNDPRSVLGSTVRDKSQLLQESDQFQLALTLLVEYNRSDSFWRPYLDTLPKEDTDQPLLWDSKKWQELQSPLIVEQIKGSLYYLQSKMPLLNSLKTTYSTLFPSISSDDDLFQQFVWCFYLVSSRTFHFMDVQTRSYFQAMVPLVDLPNHSFGTVTGMVDERAEADQSHTAVFKTHPSGVVVSPHSELTVAYQNSMTHASTYFLHRYGMLDDKYQERTVGDFVVLKHQGQTLFVNHKGQITNKPTQLSDAAVWTEDVLTRLKLAMARLPTTLEHDQELLQSGSSSTPRSALLLRIRFKQVLHNCLAWLQAGAKPTPSNDNGIAMDRHTALFEMNLDPE